MSWSSRKKKKCIFCIKFEESFFNICDLSQNNVLNKLSEYIYFYISKNITSYTFLLAFKFLKISVYP